MKSFIIFLTTLCLQAAFALPGLATDPLSSPAEERLVRDPRNPLDTPIGQVFLAGTSWYDMQHNGTTGRMVALDTAGFAHVVWTNGFDVSNTQRHVFYNLWSPVSNGFAVAGGLQIDNAQRAGFVTAVVSPDGRTYPAYHATNAGLTFTQGGMEFTPNSGAFVITEPVPATVDDTLRAVLWPKIAIDPIGNVHAVASYAHEFGNTVFYARGIPTMDGLGFALGVDWQPQNVNGAEFRFVDSASTVSVDIAASATSSRLAIAYTKLRPEALNVLFYNSDVLVTFSEDGGLNWSAPQNITNFTNADDQRPFVDLSIVFDDNDDLQLVFTASNFIENPDSTWSVSAYRGRIWHWNEASGEFHVVASDWTEGTHLPGANLLNVCRPSISFDSVTGYLYCAYRKFNQNSWSVGGYAESDIFVSVSADDGAHWSVGTNATDTVPVSNPTPAGSCQSERDVTLADRVTYEDGEGILHLSWVLDFDNGTWLLSEGTRTRNEFYYQRINVNDLPTTPFEPDTTLHFVIPAIDDLTIHSDAVTQSFTLRWSETPGANTYHVYRSTNLSTLFSPLSFYAAVGDTAFTCAGCLNGSPDQEYFGVIAARVIEIAAQRAPSRPSTGPKSASF